MKSTSIRIHLLSTRSTKVIFNVLAAGRLMVDVSLLLCLGRHGLTRAAGVEEGETGPE